jgi:hypothetical protein
MSNAVNQCFIYYNTALDNVVKIRSEYSIVLPLPWLLKVIHVML